MLELSINASYSSPQGLFCLACRGKEVHNYRSSELGTEQVPSLSSSALSLYRGPGAQMSLAGLSEGLS